VLTDKKKLSKLNGWHLYPLREGLYNSACRGVLLKHTIEARTHAHTEATVTTVYKTTLANELTDWREG